MQRLRAAAIFLVTVSLLSSPVFSQSNNATVGGTVADPSGALVPGVSIKATNQATGIVNTVISNDAGAYNFASLLPGPYNISAELPGFRTQTYSDVQLGTAAQLRLNFTLTVASVAQSVDVTIPAQSLITSSSSSVGEVLPQKQIQDLPLVSNNVLDLVGVMAGVFMTNDPTFGAEQTNFAGVSARDVNVQRDGISINNQRWPNGLDSPTRMNPDLVGEIKLILAPVDAEMGRGNGQVQIQTRSGTNQYHGLAVWNVQNSALDANTWQNNSRSPVRTEPAWRNLQEYNIAMGGPIRKNKTFFYVLWDQQIAISRNTWNPTVLTDCARRGIFRYYDGVNNGNSRQTTIAGAVPTMATVNADGSPKAPLAADGTPLPLRFLSVFGGPLAVNPTKNDCSDAQIGPNLVPTGATTSLDTYRKELDKSGVISKMLDLMPQANSFDNPGNLVAAAGFFGATYAPDGLNTATHRWVRTAKGADNLFGVGQDNNRRQINAKIDHNFNSNHKINGSYSYEIDTSYDAALPDWPKGYYGLDKRKPQVLSVGFTSTLSSSLVNEARFGLSRTGANTGGGLDRQDVADEVKALFPVVNGQTVLTNIGFQNMAFVAGVQGLSFASKEVSPRWTYADTVSWTRGSHAFKFGAEYRMSSTKSTLGGSVQTGPNRPQAAIGNTLLTPIVGIGRPGLAGTGGAFGAGNQLLAENMLTWLSGSLATLAQGRFVNNLSESWNDFDTDPMKIRDIHQNEIGTFFKDDWKVSRNLTLNLGIRWDYYGVPWEKNGLTTGLRGGGNALFGLSGRSFADWMRPGVRGELTELIYVGPNSPNPDEGIYKRDLNNFGPAVGFSWQVPWGGAGKTTVRGGYQIQFLGGGRGFVLDTTIGNPPGSSNTANYIIPTTDPYFSLEKLIATPSLVPVQPSFLPKATGNIIPVTDRTALLNAFDPNFLAPSVQNLTLSVTRNLTSKVTLDLRYIGTLSRKLWANLDLNAANFRSNGLLEAFDAARRGGESQLLNDMFAGLNIAGPFAQCRDSAGAVTACTAVGSPNGAGVMQTGAMHLRASGATSANLANGNYSGIATTLNTLTNAAATNGGQNPNLSGSVLRNSRKFPENFIKANPQVNNAVLETNLGHANYHSWQTQVSLRPTAGVSMQATYTFSRNLGQAPAEGPNGQGSTFTDPVDRMADYALLGNHRKHTMVTYGTFALPIGPEKLLFSNASGIWARLAENWQASWIVNLSSGAPGSILASNMLYGLGVPDIVGPFDAKAQSYAWVEGKTIGNLFSDDKGNALYAKVKDPQCNNTSIVVSYLAASCTLNALQTVATGQVVLQNPLPGKRGNFGQMRLEGLGNWSTDMAVQKRVQVGESRSFTLRLDATNVFNHPTPTTGGLFAATGGVGDYNMQSLTNPFGGLISKTGNRRFQLKARLDF